MAATSCATRFHVPWHNGDPTSPSTHAPEPRPHRHHSPSAPPPLLTAGELDEEVAAKAAFALDQGLGVLACIGESLEEREAGVTTEKLFAQCAAYAATITDWSKVVLA